MLFHSPSPHHLLLSTVTAPVVTVKQLSVMPPSMQVIWTSGGMEGVSYEVQWTYSGGCAVISGGNESIGESRSYTIAGLEEFITYSITVRASNSLGNATSTAVSGTTSEASKSIHHYCVCVFMIMCVHCRTYCPSKWCDC